MSEARDPRSFLATCLVQYGYSHDTAETVVQNALDTHVREQAEAVIKRVEAIAARWEKYGSTDLRTAARILRAEVLGGTEETDR